jgi:hypothetical protein
MIFDFEDTSKETLERMIYSDGVGRTGKIVPLN